MPDGVAHAADLAVAALVDDEAQDAGREHADLGGCGRAVVELDALAQRPQGTGGGVPAATSATYSLATPCDGWESSCDSAPSLVRMRRPSVWRSSRPTGNTRGSAGTSVTTVGRPWGSSAVVMTPSGLFSR